MINDLLSPLQLRDITIPNRLMMAPLAGYTDSPFRQIVRHCGAGLLFTEMISSEAIVRNKWDKSTKFQTKEKPIIAQIFGGRKEAMLDAALQLLDKGYDGININAGCPVKKVIKAKAGSYLLTDLDRLYSIVDYLRQHLEKNLSVKIRLGWKEKNHINIGKLIQDAGADFIIVHGRTKEEGFAGGIDLSAIKQLKEQLNIPVIANGNIFTRQDIESTLQKTKADAIMIGRGAIGQPCIFDITNRFNNSKHTLMRKHLLLLIDFYGKERAIREYRKHFVKYIKGFSQATQLRQSFLKLTELNKILLFIDNLNK